MSGSVICQLVFLMILHVNVSNDTFNFDPPASIVDCGAPPNLTIGVIVEAYTSTLVNSDIFFQCRQPGLVPSYRSATCGSDGRWSPDPSQVECRMVTPMPTGTPLLTSTVPTGTPVPTGIKSNYSKY